ncbi:MAG: divergent polysaccharide deacetylase family protein [Gammaproteobacteria bacterium]
MAALAAALLIAGCAVAPPPVAILIDDLGYRRTEGAAAIALPGPVAVAVLPHTPHGPLLARAARAAGKEVLLHMPMEADTRHTGLGQGALRVRMDRAAFDNTLRNALASVPHLSGLNNHMGSRLTRDPERMNWLMGTLRRAGPRFFVDSRTTPQTVAARAARHHGLAHLSRDVFLDTSPSRGAIARALRELVGIAHRQGSALAIGHPLPQTLAALAAWNPAREGVRLVSLQALLVHRARALPGPAPHLAAGFATETACAHPPPPDLAGDQVRFTPLVVARDAP